MLARGLKDIISVQIMSNHQVYQKENPVILAVDTTSAAASMAITSATEVLASIKTDSQTQHSNIFFEQLTLLLRDAGVRLPDIDVLAAATGPGSFTGLRVGLAAIKGLSQALERPAIGVNTLDAVALASKAVGKILVLIGAGRRELFVGIRLIGPERIPYLSGTDLLIPALSLQRFFDSKLEQEALKIAYAGKPLDIKPTSLGIFREIIEVNSNIAEEIALFAGNKLNIHRSLQLDSGLRPHYIRPADAEKKIMGGSVNLEFPH